jgi:hypothetical protein
MSAKRSRGVLSAILVYVTLDLSLPAMPGAFVFELVDSAKSTQIRARAGSEKSRCPPRHVTAGASSSSRRHSHLGGVSPEQFEAAQKPR